LKRNLTKEEKMKNDGFGVTRLMAGILLSLFVISNALALSEADKRRYRKAHEQEYENGTMQHHVPLAAMKKLKEARFAHDPAVRDCIEKAATPPAIGACIDAWRGTRMGAGTNP
jgi:hypothetical protein